MAMEVIMRFVSPLLSVLMLWIVLPSIASSDATLVGSKAARAAENRAADDAGLVRLRDTSQLKGLIARKLLVRIVSGQAYVLDDTLGECDPSNRDLYAHVRPWTKKFLDTVLGVGYRKFGEAYTLTSMVRTKTYVRCLMRRNANAVADSTHLTGATVDISTLHLSRANVAWLRETLLMLERQGLVRATEERRAQACFHVLVLPSYPAH